MRRRFGQVDGGGQRALRPVCGLRPDEQDRANAQRLRRPRAVFVERSGRAHGGAAEREHHGRVAGIEERGEVGRHRQIRRVVEDETGEVRACRPVRLRLREDA